MKGFIIILSLLFTSCQLLTGEELARLKIDKISTSEENFFEEETTLDLKKDDELVFWSEMDIEYSGDASFEFRFRVYKDNKPFGIIEFDPTEKKVTIGQIKTIINGKTKWSFTGRNKKIKIKETGRYKFKGILKTTTNHSIKINKSEVFLKL